MAAPTPTPTATPSPTPTATPTPTPTATPRPTPSQAPEPTPTATPESTPLVGVALSAPGYTNNYTHHDSTLYVYPEQLTILETSFTWAEEIPEGSTLRITRINGINGNYGEAPIQSAEDEKSLSAVIRYDAQLGYFDYLDVTAFAPDGTKLFTITYAQHRILFGDYEWRQMEPIADSPDVPIQIPYSQREYHAKYSNERTVLHVDPDATSTLTVRFRYADALPEGAMLRLTRVDGTDANFGEALITPSTEEGILTAVFHFDQQVGYTQYFTLQGCAPDGSQLFETYYELNRYQHYPDRWLTLPALQPSLASATEPPYKTALVKCTYNLQDKVTKYSHYNTTFRQYADFNTLNVFFFYKTELPEGAYMRVVSAGGVAGDYGEAVIGPANVEGTDPSLLNAKIFSRTLPAAATLSLECCSPDGTVLFPLDFTIKDVSYPAGRENVPAVTPYRDPYGNSGSGNSVVWPFPTPTPYKSWIEEGMYIQTPDPYGGGFFVVTPNPYGYTSPGSSWYNGGSYWGW